MPLVYRTLLALHVACLRLFSACACSVLCFVYHIYYSSNYACKLFVHIYLVEMLIISSNVRLGFVELYDNQALVSEQLSSDSTSWSRSWSRTSFFRFSNSSSIFHSFPFSSSSSSSTSIFWNLSFNFLSCHFSSFQILLVVHSVRVDFPVF